MPLNLSPPFNFSKHLNVIPDKTLWTPGHYKLKRGDNTPDRARASFKTLHNALNPCTPFGNALSTAYGIYILAFDVPHCHLYVGIAAFGGIKPEGILSRIKKHRVKATGSHVGNIPSSCGGVNHTRGWREFATLRAQYFLKTRQDDTLADARLILGRIHQLGVSPLNKHQTKSALEAYENAICKNSQNLDEIRKRLWPRGSSQFRLITKKTNSRLPVGEIFINFW